jgi:hypothetical protein
MELSGELVVAAVLGYFLVAYGIECIKLLFRKRMSGAEFEDWLQTAFPFILIFVVVMVALVF